MVTQTVRKPLTDRLFLLLGIIGSVFLLYGLTLSHAVYNHRFYVIGSFLLLSTAIHFKLTYFIALETILWCGHLSTMLELNYLVSIILPILLSVQFIIYAFLSGMLSNYFLFIGILGIAFITTGFIIHNNLIFFIGSLSIAIYSWHLTYRGIKISLLWAITNSLFALVTLINIFRGIIW